MERKTRGAREKERKSPLAPAPLPAARPGFTWTAVSSGRQVNGTAAIPLFQLCQRGYSGQGLVVETLDGAVSFPVLGQGWKAATALMPRSWSAMPGPVIPLAGILSCSCAAEVDPDGGQNQLEPLRCPQNWGTVGSRRQRTRSVGWVRSRYAAHLLLYSFKMNC